MAQWVGLSADMFFIVLHLPFSKIWLRPPFLAARRSYKLWLLEKTLWSPFSMSTRVAIIGAGPAGLVLAATLAKKSSAFSVKVFEQGADHKAAASYDPNRSYTIDITGHGALAVEALGATELFDEKLIKFKGLRILITGEDHWFDGNGWTGSRGDICKTLLGVIDEAASPNVEVLFDTTAEVLDMMKGTVQTTSKAGERAVHEFDVVVGADGAGSKLRGVMSKLPSFAMSSINMENYSIMLHMDQNTSELDPGLLHIFGTDPFLVAGAINGNGGKSDPLWFCQVGFKGLDKGKWLQEASLKDLKTKLKKSGWPKSTDLLRYVSDKSLQEFQARMPQATGKGKMVSPWSHGRCVLVGDAGAPFPPIGLLASPSFA